MQTAATSAPIRMRTAFAGRALSTSTKTHTAARPPVTPKAACARRITSLIEIFKTKYSQQTRRTHAIERGSRGRLILIARLVAIRLFAPGPIQPKVGVVLRLSDRRMAITEQQLK